MDVTIAMLVGVAMLGMCGLVGASIVRDLRRMNKEEAYYEDQRRLMARLELMRFEDGLFEFNRREFFDRIDEYRAGLS
jgi:hypothetical protein